MAIEIYGITKNPKNEALYTNGKEYTQKSDIYSFGIIMSEVFTGYPPYHDVPHEFGLALEIYKGLRPKIRCEVPQLFLELMNKCLDAEPQNRPTAEELDKYFITYDQVKHQTHPQAIYTSRLLNFSKLFKPGCYFK
ncbi:kinase-like domain-containing protein [Gigaspora rosea]|uniref:mitogen-activated protein kinase kinase n=1 Tax=Gigaspora rosea TaxID=44941 RepID=A0A397UWY2_9GLOM|nr:kinase-like domain-containing protein [Gigaspora rosea]